MAAITSTDLKTLDYDYNGEPFCQVDFEKLNTETLDHDLNGEPFVAIRPPFAPIISVF